MVVSNAELPINKQNQGCIIENRNYGKLSRLIKLIYFLKILHCNSTQVEFNSAMHVSNHFSLNVLMTCTNAYVIKLLQNDVIFSTLNYKLILICVRELEYE